MRNEKLSDEAFTKIQLVLGTIQLGCFKHAAKATKTQIYMQDGTIIPLEGANISARYDIKILYYTAK